MLIFIYNIISIALFPLYIISLIFRIFSGKEDLEYISERFFPQRRFYQSILRKDKLIWIHAASVGEGILALNLINSIRERNIAPESEILITCMTVSARRIIEKNIPEKCNLQLLPADNLIFTSLFLNYWKPSLCIFVESEFWPCILKQTSSFCKILLVNARMSDKSFARWSFFDSAFYSIVKNFTEIIVQSETDLKKFHNLGMIHAKNFGNLKFANRKLKVDTEKANAIENILKDKKIIVCASTHETDEELLIPAIKELLKESKSFYFIIIPRHISRKQDIAKMLQSAELSFSICSDANLPNAQDDIFIVDKMGQLGTYYNIALISFIGGSCARIGGHSPIEPAKFGNAIICGPDMSNFKDIAKNMIDLGCMISIQNSMQFKDTILKISSDKDFRNQMKNNSLEFASKQESKLDDYFELIRKYTNIK